MGFRTNREELLARLHQVEPGRSTKAYIEQSTCFVLGSGSVMTFNDEIFCRTKTGLPDEVAGAVYGQELLDCLDRLKEDEVEVECSGGKLLVRAGRARVGIALQKEITLPVENVDSPDAWHPLPEDFAKAVAAVCPVAGTNREEFLATCVHVHPEWVEATDRKKALRYEMTWTMPKPSLVRATSISPVVPLGVTRFGLTDQWLHFRNRGLIFSCRRHLEEYFDLTQFFDFEGQEATLPKGAEDAAKLGAIFSTDKDNDKLLVTIRDGQMSVRGEGVRGFAEVPLDIAYRGEPVTFRIAPATLEHLVKNYGACQIGDGRLKVEGDRWSFISVLGRPTAETAAVHASTDTDDEGRGDRDEREDDE